jgi:hypothetical protein
LLKKSNFLICQKSTTAVTLLLTTWQQQQHHQTANYIMYTEKPATGLRHSSIPTPASKTDEKPSSLCCWWPGIGRNSESFAL